MADDRKDREWLRKKLVGLLEDASHEEKTDHGACAKYADLLFKMLPESTGPKDEGSSVIAEARRRALNEMAREKEE